MIFLQLFTTGSIPRDSRRTHFLDVVTALPAAAGLVIALTLLLSRRPPRTLPQILCFILGVLGCSLFVFSFGYEFFH